MISREPVYGTVSFLFLPGCQKEIIYYSGKDGPMGVGHPLHAKKKWDNLKNQI